MFSLSEFKKKHAPKPVIQKPVIEKPLPEPIEKKTRRPRKKRPVLSAEEQKKLFKEHLEKKRTTKVFKEVKKVPEPKQQDNFTSKESIKNEFMNHPEKLTFLRDNKDRIKGLNQEDKKDLMMFFKDFTNN